MAAAECAYGNAEAEQIRLSRGLLADRQNLYALFIYMRHFYMRFL
jgi:hypothetical protein